MEMAKMENNEIKNSKLIPRLRFPGFEVEWEEKKLGEVTTWDKYFQGVPRQLQLSVIKYPYVLANVFSAIARKEGNVLLLSTGNYAGWTTEELAGENMCEGEIVAIPWGGTANIKYVKGKFVTADNRIATSSNLTILNNKFLYYTMLFNKDKIDGFYRGAGIKHPSMFDVLNMQIHLPVLLEQEKIASCLSELDNLIAAQGQKVDALKEKKKALMQQLFPQPGETTPRLRFPGFEGEWEEKKLGEIADRCTSRNRDKTETRVLTNSATEGVVDQNAYFDRNIAIKENTDNYNIVDLDDFVYNPRISTSAPVGPISRNKIGRGIMSPLYSVFRFKSENIDYLEHYFSTTIWHRYLKSVANYGARFDRMAISTEDFYSMPILCPIPAEQQKIASCLSSLDDLIAAESTKVEALKDHKKGLMQQLFPQGSEISRFSNTHLQRDAQECDEPLGDAQECDTP